MSADSPPRSDYAIALAAYGAPGGLDEVEPYLRDVRGGRPTPPEVLEELKRRYAAIGGRSPLLERTREQAEGVRRRLGDGARVVVGMRHWHPYLRDTLAEIGRDGIRRVVVIPLAPHYSSLSIGAYERAVDAGRGGLEVALVRQWHDHPRFLDAVAERVRDALARFPAGERGAVPVLFTAHSLPRRILAAGDPYVAQLEASVSGVMERLSGDPARARLGFQSAGRTPEPWLEPEAGRLIEALARSGERNVVVCPIGFVSDHLEVLYDVDVELAGLARRFGVRLERTESLNASRALVEALADLATRTAAERGWS